MREIKLLRILTIFLFLTSFMSCTDEDEPTENELTENEATNITWTITIEAFTLADDTYTSTGKTLIFDSKEKCQTWSRTANGDDHNSNSHLHYNAAANVNYDNTSVTFTWTEYGPEIDQISIENTCSNGVNGITKTVNNKSYYQDKPNLYLKIVSVVEN